VEIWGPSVSTVILAAPVSLTDHLSLIGGATTVTKVILRNYVNIKSKAIGFADGAQPARRRPGRRVEGEVIAAGRKA
jgi:hypothetical protein